MELDHFTPVVITLEPTKGAQISQCKKEALVVSMRYGINVIFVFSGRQYKVEYEALLECVR